MLAYHRQMEERKQVVDGLMLSSHTETLSAPTEVTGREQENGVGVGPIFQDYRDCGEQVHNFEEVLPVGNLLNSALRVVPGDKQVEEGHDGALEPWTTTSIDRDGRQILVHDVPDVDGNEQRDTTAKTVALLEEFVGQDHNHTSDDELKDQQEYDNSAKLSGGAIEDSEDIDDGSVGGEDEGEEPPRGLVELMMGLKVEAAVNHVGDSEELEDHAGGDDWDDTQLHQGNASSSEDLQFLASEEHDIPSEASVETTNETMAGKAILGLMLLDHTEFRSLSERLLVGMGEQGFVKSLRLLLKLFYKNIMVEAKDEGQRAVAKALRNRRGRLRSRLPESDGTGGLLNSPNTDFSLGDLAYCGNANNTNVTYILFGVQGSQRTLTPGQVCVSDQSTDSTVFQDLKECYETRRGFWRLWLSIWRLDYCHVAKWPCKIYDPRTLTIEQLLQLRANRRDITRPDSHGYIWLQAVTAESQKENMFHGKVEDMLGQMSDTLQLHDEAGVPLRRLVTLWRNERWKAMITNTIVGRGVATSNYYTLGSELQETGLDGDLGDAVPVGSNDGSYDEHYLDVDDAAADRSASVHTGEFKVLHQSGASKLKRRRTEQNPTVRRQSLTYFPAEEFIARTMAADFDATQALDMLQHRYTMDYGRRSTGSKPASTADEYYPTFHLDMISVVGKPLHAITNQSSFFDNVTFTLQHWAAPYSSTHATLPYTLAQHVLCPLGDLSGLKAAGRKIHTHTHTHSSTHAISSLPFEVVHRTFRLATGASREIWFVVMHPIQQEAFELPESHAGRRSGSRADGRRSGMRRHHVEALSSYIKDIFLDGALLGEGVEPCWTLGERRSQNITFEKWSMFQELFMERWHIFANIHAHDQSWADHQPAFHAYDHGANIPIQVNEALEALPRETTLRADEYESESESESESEASRRSEAGDDDDSLHDDVEEALLSVREREEIAEEDGSDEESSLVSGRQPSRKRSRGEGSVWSEAEVEGTQRELYSDKGDREPIDP
ncbi:hypothetical protein S40288_10098 [Stachybotrys chartarum IBT 40288]|nr:hypothetical protein S40288_10098 [Stachybotrys chartarum IBT 40288]